jgi:hypothetical protein
MRKRAFCVKRSVRHVDNDGRWVMKKISWRRIFILLVGVLALPPFLMWLIGTFERPPLLRFVDSQGGNTYLCPPSNESERILAKYPPALSRALTNRLINEFPAGTEEQVLLDELSREGFQLLPPCKSDSTIKSAHYNNEGDIFTIYGINGTVWWKVSLKGKIEWAKGVVSFSFI